MRCFLLIAALAACDEKTSSSPIDATAPDVIVADAAHALPPRVLVFTRTLGYRHGDAIDTSTQVLPARLAALGIDADLTEDPAAFSSTNLARYGAVLFLYTSGNNVLDGGGKEALEAFVRAGGGWLGIHSASDTEYEWPFYQQLVVSHFRSHPAIQQATVHVEAPTHPAMANVTSPWQASDEWYDFLSDPRATQGVTVLATLDESTYQGGVTGADHPIIWAHERHGGRVLYSALGHVASRWSEPAFATHVDNAVRWVLRRD